MCLIMIPDNKDYNIKNMTRYLCSLLAVLTMVGSAWFVVNHVKTLCNNLEDVDCNDRLLKGICISFGSMFLIIFGPMFFTCNNRARALRVPVPMNMRSSAQSENDDDDDDENDSDGPTEDLMMESSNDNERSHQSEDDSSQNVSQSQSRSESRSYDLRPSPMRMNSISTE